MPDIVDSTTRSRMMAGIRSTNTRPELTIRKALHAAGFRYRLHPRDVPGKPDMAFARYRAAVFVNGCFWHGHDADNKSTAASSLPVDIQPILRVLG